MRAGVMRKRRKMLREGEGIAIFFLIFRFNFLFLLLSRSESVGEIIRSGGLYKDVKAGLNGVIKLNMWAPRCFVISGFYGIPIG